MDYLQFFRIINTILNYVFHAQLADAPSAHGGRLGESSKAKTSTADDDIARQLAALRDL